MAEHAIGYTKEMRAARRNGWKKQTRRVLSKQPPATHFRPYEFTWDPDGFWWGFANYEEGSPRPQGTEPHWGPIRCPYGEAGDILYVKEPIEWVGFETEPGGRRTGLVHYLDDGPDALPLWVEIPGRVKHPKLGRWRGRTMPPEWARHRDIITEIRVERVQDISDEDAWHEGCGTPCQSCGYTLLDDMIHWDHGLCHGDGWSNAKAEFETLWDSINAKRGHAWDLNDWVWAISFEEAK